MQWPVSPMLNQRELAYSNVVAKAQARQIENRQRDLRAIRRARNERFAQQHARCAERWAR